MKWRERLGIRPTTITVATEGFSSAFYTTSFGLEAPTLLHRQRAPLEEITFSGAVTYSQNEMSIQPLHVRRLSSTFYNMAYMAAHRPEPSATPDTVVCSMDLVSTLGNSVCSP